MDGSVAQRIHSQIADFIGVKNRLLADESIITSIESVGDACVAALTRGNKVILAGNGGSAADAQHIAAEFVSRFEFDRPGSPAIALNTDTSMLTAIDNDYGFEKVYRNGRSGDVFIAISTSGNSRNILVAREGCRPIGIFSARLAGQSGLMNTACDHIIAVPSKNTARIQEAHILIGHIICGFVESAMFRRRVA